MSVMAVALALILYKVLPSACAHCCALAYYTYRYKILWDFFYFIATSLLELTE